MINNYYNLKKHRIAIRIKIIVLFFLIVFTIPWLIGLIEWIFGLIPIWKAEGEFNIGVLPDFLGGAIGILLGFFIENLYFNQLKLLSQYEAACKSLNHLFSNIETECKELKVDNLFHLHSEIFDEIMNSVEKDSLFHGLPIYWNFIKKSRDIEIVKAIYESLHKINGNLRAIENNLYCFEKTGNHKYSNTVVGVAKTLLTNIKEFKDLAKI